jgi:ubiquinone/menaquinone biosynthesis C-methylase UbiE
MPEFDRHAATYASAVNDSIAFSGLKVDTFVKAKLFHLRQVFKRNGILANDRVVDVGCGVGTYEMSLVNDWPNIVGIDVSPESIAQARQHRPMASFKSFDGKQMPFESSSVAAAFAICVWHHVPIEDWALFLKEIFRILRPSGIFVVFEHNPWNPLTRWAVERCVFDKDAVLLSMPQARRRMSAAGFSLKQSEYILSVPATTGFAGQVDRWLGSVPTGAQYLVVGSKGR